MKQSLDLPSSLRLNDHRCIDQDITCTSCDYNLRTILLDANCPECGQPVIDSLDPNRLCFADPKWLKRVRLGLGIVLLSGLNFIALLITVIIARQLSMTRVEDLTEVIAIFQLPIFSFLGHWLFTTAQPGYPGVAGDPGIPGVIPGQKLRLWTRGLLVLGTLSVLAGFTLLQFADDNLMISVPLIGVPAVVIAVAILSYARTMALRIPARRTAVALILLMWAWASVMTFGFSLIVINDRYSLPLWQSLPHGILNAMFDFVNAGCYSLILIGFILLVVYRRQLGRVLRSMG